MGRNFRVPRVRLTLDNVNAHNGKPSLKIVGDFSGGGNYVAVVNKIPDVDARELSMWVRNPDSDRLTLRINDGSGQTHQIVLKTATGTDWQRIVFPLQQFFARQGQADAVTGIAKYEYWGGANDGKWHGAATEMAVLVSPTEKVKVRNLWLNEIVLTPRPNVANLPKVASVIRLDNWAEDETDGWKVESGDGASANIALTKDEPAAGQSSLKYLGEMPEGGAGLTYLTRDLRDLQLADLTALRMRVKSENVTSITFRLVDGTGQTHQLKGVPVVADGKWHDLVIESKAMNGIEHWAGANDGVWHAQPLEFTLIFNGQSSTKDRKPALLLSDIRADAIQAAVVQPAAFKSDFENTTQLPAGWNGSAETTISTTGAFKGQGALRLSRVVGAANNERAIIANGPGFAVTAGQWQFGAATRSELKSPDDSYSGAVSVEFLDGDKVTQSVNLAEVYGQHGWQPVSKIVEVPRGVTKARFAVRLNKPSGQFWVDEVSAAYLAPAPRKDNRVARLLFSTPQIGHLWYPQ